MSITALVWALLYCAAIVFSFLGHPVFGSLGYLLEYYMRPELRWWGRDLPGLRYNLIISMVLGATFLLHRGALRPMEAVRNPILRWLIGLGAIMVMVTFTVAIDSDISWNWTVQWFKMALIFPLLLVGVLRTRDAFNAFVASHMLGAFWWGWIAWIDPKRSAGRLMEIGSGDSLNDNAASAHLLTVIPFCLLYLLTEKDKRLRLVALISTPVVINTIVLCNSRGSMVGLLAALAASLFLIRTGYRLRLVGAGIAFIAAFLTLADDTFIRRQQTTANYQEDGSAQQRLETWTAGYQLVKDRPLGAGGRGFHLLSPQYIPEIVEQHNGELRAPHNTAVMVASEWGVAGFIAYLGTFASVFLVLRRVKRQAGGPSFYYWRALAIQLALVANQVAGLFTDRLYGEAAYWMIGLAFALYRMQCTELAEAASVPAPARETTGVVLTPSLAGARS